MSDIGKTILLGLIISAFGVYVIGLAVWGEEARMHAPRWVVGAAGAVFLLGGLLVFGERLPLFSAVVRALLVTAMASAFVWVSFLPGDREFTGTVSVPFLSVQGPTSELAGRLCFAPGAIVTVGLALYLWVKLAWDWLGGNSEGG